MAGYSGTPLVRKLGIGPDMRLFVHGEPANYRELIAPIPEGVTFLRRLANDLDLVHLFVTEKAALVAGLMAVRPRIVPAGVIWVSWPKKASKVPTDVTEDTVRELALPLGLVDVKVCAVDEVWSGLKLVIRRENRPEG